LNSHLKKSEHSHERHRGKTQRLPRFLREYRGEVPGCPGGVGAYGGLAALIDRTDGTKIKNNKEMNEKN